MKTSKKVLFCWFLFTILTPLWAQKETLVHSYNREYVALDGYWKYIVDPYENGFYNYRYQPFEAQETPSNNAYFKNYKPQNKQELIEYNFDLSDSILIPQDWNSHRKELYYYEGTVWFKKSFEHDHNAFKKTDRFFLHFGASNYQADVYLNGIKVGLHLGGFTPFSFEVTNLIKEGTNDLVVKVDNKRRKEGVPTLNTDWWNYGGITRSVKLIKVPHTYIGDYFIRLDTKNANSILFNASLVGNERSKGRLSLLIPELSIDTILEADVTGKISARFKATRIRNWNITDPYRYRVDLKSESDSISDQIGFRTIETKGTEILLNKRPLFLKGISIHEEKPYVGGRANTKEDALQIFKWVKELGCNYVRLAHYPHNEHMVQVADSLGILVWEEIPVYWTIDWENEETLGNAQSQLKEMIHRDKNRASVIIWSMANETPNSPQRLRFLSTLAQDARTIDGTRLISAALEQSSLEGNEFVRTIDDPFASVVDVLSFNQYIGWYDGLPEKCSKISWEITQNKPVIVSEFGAGAKSGFFGDKNERWTEDYQAFLYEETLKMLEKNPNIRGMSPWILVDFKSPRRVLPRIQDGWNRKGLISEDGQYKKAFYVLQKYYKGKDR